MRYALHAAPSFEGAGMEGTLNPACYPLLLGYVIRHRIIGDNGTMPMEEFNPNGLNLVEACIKQARARA